MDNSNAVACAHCSTLIKHRVGLRDMAWCLDCSATKIGNEPWSAPNNSRTHKQMVNQMPAGESILDDAWRRAPIFAGRANDMSDKADTSFVHSIVVSIDEQLADIRKRLAVCEADTQTPGDKHGPFSARFDALAARLKNSDAMHLEHAQGLRDIRAYLRDQNCVQVSEAPNPNNVYIVVEVSDPKSEDYYAVFCERALAEAYIADIQKDQPDYKFLIIDTEPRTQ